MARRRPQIPRLLPLALAANLLPAQTEPGLNLVGAAAHYEGRIRLTPAERQLSGAVWQNGRQPVSAGSKRLSVSNSHSSVAWAPAQTASPSSFRTTDRRRLPAAEPPVASPSATATVAAIAPASPTASPSSLTPTATSTLTTRRTTSLSWPPTADLVTRSGRRCASQ